MDQSVKRRRIEIDDEEEDAALPSSSGNYRGDGNGGDPGDDSSDDSNPDRYVDDSGSEPDDGEDLDETWMA